MDRRHSGTSFAARRSLILHEVHEGLRRFQNILIDRSQWRLPRFDLPDRFFGHLFWTLGTPSLVLSKTLYHPLCASTGSWLEPAELLRERTDVCREAVPALPRQVLGVLLAVGLIFVLSCAISGCMVAFYPVVTLLSPRKRRSSLECSVGMPSW